MYQHPTRAVAAATMLALAAATAAPAFAQPTVIATLGTAPLLGQATSTADLRDKAHANSALLDAAARKLGLTDEEYKEFRFRLDAGHLQYVTVPRHLDAMTWQAGGVVHVIPDVVIPAGTRGWETDIQENGRVVALFMPAKCGNLSVVRRALPRVAAAKVTAPPPAPVAVAPAPPPPEAVAVAAPPPPAPAPVVAAAIPPPVAAASRGVGLLPLLGLVPLLIGGGGGGGGGGSVGTVGPPPCP